MTSRVDSQDLVYYNASIYAPDTGGIIPAAVSDTRGTPILDVPEDWQVSVVRFDVTAQLLPPVTFPLPLPFPTTSQLQTPSLCTVTLQYLGINYTQPVQVVYLDTSYTFGTLYTCDAVAQRINQAYAACYAMIPGVLPSSAPPVFVFDPVTQLMSMYYQETYATAPNRIQVYMNRYTFNYLLTLECDFFGYDTPGGLDYRVQTESTNARTVPAAPRTGFPVGVVALAGNVLVLSQEGSSLQAWSGVRSIVITTSMPINSESLPQTTSPGQSQNFSSNSVPILSDFILSGEPGENPVVDRINILYLPTSEYRMAQLRGREALKRIELKFFYSMNDGSLRELLIPPGGHASAKLMFRRVKWRD